MTTKAFDTELKVAALPSEHAEHPRAGIVELTPEEEEFLAAVSPEEADRIYHKVSNYSSCKQAIVT